MLSIWLIKKFKIKAVNGEEIKIADKEFNKGQIIGGTIFGMGWALSGACPGPLYSLVGSGYYLIFVVIISAIFGTWLYSYFKPKLPH
jgi:uncharacterized membrane protein YedE/YeeE